MTWHHPGLARSPRQPRIGLFALQVLGMVTSPERSWFLPGKPGPALKR